MAAFLKRLFHRAQIPKSADQKELVDLAYNLLTTQIGSGNGLPGGPNRSRLEMPYARGYVFGFVDTLVRKGGIDETRVQGLISVVHAKIFGKGMGSVFIADALAHHSPDSAFARGRTTGESELNRWVAKSSVPPALLSDYLNAPARRSE